MTNLEFTRAKDIIVNKLKSLGMNAAQTETAIEIFDTVSIYRKQHWLKTLTGCQSAKEIINQFIIPFNLQKMDKGIKESIKGGLHQIIAVAGESGYAYSVGLSVLKDVDHELVVGAGIGNLGGSVINDLVKRYPNSDYPLNEVIISNAITPERIRIQLVKNTSVFTATYFARIDRWLDKFPAKLYLVELADKNNILPGEEGYDESFNQLSVQVIKGHAPA